MVDMGVLVGSVRRFGLEGPVYEILGVGSLSADGEQHVRVAVVASGEEFDYPVADVLTDPIES